MVKLLPKVSIGIPTYNRPQGLRRTLECITGQTYENLEIIVSDNASFSGETEEVLREFIKKDHRIIFFLQPENKGASFNFKFVLEKATGEYFMWAADDDWWVPGFIENLVLFFQNSKNTYIAAITEGQYMQDISNKYDFFSEGESFYSFYSEDKMQRLKHMLRSNYGNLVYGLFKSSVLKTNILFAENEIPFLLQIIEKGNFKVLPEIGFYKTAPSFNTYLQAKWEKTGGVLPNSSFSLKYYKRLRTDFNYHKIAFYNIKTSIRSLDLNYLQKTKLMLLSFYYLGLHFFHLIIRYKWKF